MTLPRKFIHDIGHTNGRVWFTATTETTTNALQVLIYYETLNLIDYQPFRRHFRFNLRLPDCCTYACYRLIKVVLRLATCTSADNTSFLERAPLRVASTR